MQVRVSDFIASHLEAIRQKLDYEAIPEVANLVLDSIKHQFDLKLQYCPLSGTKVLKLRLSRRHWDWLAQYGAERGISVTAATNLILSEHFRGKSLLFGTATPSLVIEPSPETKTETEIQAEKPRGRQLLNSLKI